MPVAAIFEQEMMWTGIIPFVVPLPFVAVEQNRYPAGLAIFRALFVVSSRGFFLYQSGTQPALPGFYTIQSDLVSDYRRVLGCPFAALSAAIVQAQSDIALLNTYVNSAPFIATFTKARRASDIPKIQVRAAACLAAINEVVYS